MENVYCRKRLKGDWRDADIKGMPKTSRTKKNKEYKHKTESGMKLKHPFWL